MESCVLKLGTTSTTSTVIYIGSSTAFNAGGAALYLKNCNFVLGATGQSISLESGFCLIDGGSIAATGSVPTTCFGVASSPFLTGQTAIIRNCDISSVTGTLFGGFGGSGYGHYYLENCKLGSGVVLTSDGSNNNLYTPDFHIHNCDSSATNYRYFYQHPVGSAQQETTVVHTGGATNGTTQVSWAITTNANSKFYTPFVSEEIAQWQDTTGSSKTATVYLTSNSSLTNGDVWLEVEYLSAAGAPLGATVNTRVTLLGSTSALTSDASTWGGAISNKYKIAATFTPQLKGPVKARLYVAKASTTLYLDPLLTIA